MTRADYLFLALIVAGLILGLAHVSLAWGWHSALAYGGVVCVGAGVIGGLRR